MRAQLYDNQGTLVAENDDRTDDWNFLISQRLSAGRYRLRIDPVGTDAATTTVAMRLPMVQPAVALALPARLRISDAHVHYYSLPSAPPGGLWAFAARSGDGAGLALERNEGGLWHSLGQQSGPAPRMLLPIGTAGAMADQYRLRVWKLSRGRAPLDLTGAVLRVSPQPASSLAQGVTLTRFDAFDPPLGVAAVQLERPGQLALDDVPSVLWGDGAHQVMSAPQQGRVAASGPLLWLARALPPGTSGQLRARRLVLGGDRPLALGLAPHGSATLDLAPLPGAGTQLVLAQSPIGAPGIRPSGAAPDMAGVAVADHSAIWLRHRSAQSAVRLWDSADAKVSLPLQLHLYGFPTAPVQELAAGSHDLALGPETSVQLRLPGGHEWLRLALPAGVAAELRRGTDTLESFWSGPTARSFDTDTEADSLALYNTRSETGEAALLTLPAPSSPALDSTRFGRYHFATAGSRAIIVRLNPAEKAAGRRLHLEGPVSGVSLIESSGRILADSAPLLHDDARVLLRHAPGFVLAWLTDTAGESQIGAKGVARQTQLPVALKLDAEASALSLDMTAPGALALHSDVPLILRVRSPGRPERLQLFGAAADLSLYLPRGATTLLFDGLTAGAPGGQVSLRPIAAEALAEGLSTPRMLAPGDSRLYHFRLDSARTVGVGVKASVDTAGCTLLDADGHQLGQGLLQMHDLAAGDYLLRVEVPADGGTVRVQAALVGARARGEGPPPEVIRQYLQAAGLKSE